MRLLTCVVFLLAYWNGFFVLLTATYADNFLEKVNISLGPSPMEMLKFLHFNDDA